MAECVSTSVHGAGFYNSSPSLTVNTCNIIQSGLIRVNYAKMWFHGQILLRVRVSYIIGVTVMSR